MGLQAEPIEFYAMLMRQQDGWHFCRPTVQPVENLTLHEEERMALAGLNEMVGAAHIGLAHRSKDDEVSCGVLWNLAELRGHHGGPSDR